MREDKFGGGMAEIEALEERIAHLIRAVEDLSDVVARQGRDLDRLLRLTQLLAEREAERESDKGPAAFHWPIKNRRIGRGR